MLVLTRKVGDKIKVIHNGEELEVCLVNINGKQVKIGFGGNKSFDIKRDDYEPACNASQKARLRKLAGELLQ